jgi:ATP-dependent DNA helicase RecG
MANDTKTREFKRITTRSKGLLTKQEGLDVDFKSDLKGLHPEDLIAFANSPEGGAILIGVEEVRMDDGRQRGKVVGCPVGDGERLLIHNKAEDCIPPVEVMIFIENAATETPFFRVEIPSSSHKPHCTRRGTYKIRGDGRSKALLPNRLLAIFMAAEGEEFIRRFTEAT